MDSQTTFGTILDEFNQQVKLTPNKPAIIEEDRVLTYRDLQTQSKDLSQQLNLDEYPIVAILLPGGADHFISILAVLNSSKAYSPLSIDYPPAKLHSMLESIGNPLLITKGSVLKEIGLSYDKVHLCDSNSKATVSANEPSIGRTEGIVVERLPEGTAAVYFTSGSTGVPKGCLVKDKGLVRIAKTGAARLKMTPSDESVYILNPAFALCMYDILMSLLSGATIHVPPNHLRYDIPKFREWVKSTGTTTMIFMVSSFGEVFFTAPPQDFPESLRVVIVAGEKLQGRPSAEIPFQVYNAYGSTEALTVASTLVGPVSPLKDPITHTLVGKAFPYVDIYILDEVSLTPLAIGETGEIAIGGPNISAGYLESGPETNQKFIQINGGIQVYRMGDLGYLMPDGNLVVLNRRDNQIKVSGFRFDLSDLESALLQHNQVSKAVAVVEKCEQLKFHLFYSLKTTENNNSVSEIEIHDFLKDRLPHYAFPHSVTRVAEFRRNAHGKLDKADLLLMKPKSKALEPPMSDTENALLNIWSEVIQVPASQISRNDNFFALGGTSLTASKLVTKLKDKKLELEVFNIFRIPVLKNLAEFLEKRSTFKLEGIKDFEAEVNSIPIDFLNIKNLASFSYGDQPKGILITGTTGYLGGSLLLELLPKTTAEIFCLIRAANSIEAQQRLEKQLGKWRMALDAKDLHRVHFVPGDLSRANFGLSDAEYNSLSESIDQVYHCAAEVHWLKRYEELRTANVVGTVEILKFCTTQKLKFLHCISTVSVLGTSGQGGRFENREVAENVEGEFGYTQTKWVAEKLVWKAIDAGVPGIIYKPGVIGARSVTNIVNPNDFITILFKACQVIGAYPNLSWTFPYGTLDFTTRAIVEISQDQEANCAKSFHTFHNMISFESFYEYFESKGLRKLSIPDWKDLVVSVKPGSEKFDKLGMIKLFLSVQYQDQLTFFELPNSVQTMNISNCETLKLLDLLEPLPDLLNMAEQVRHFGDSVFASYHVA